MTPRPAERELKSKSGSWRTSQTLPDRQMNPRGAGAQIQITLAAPLKPFQMNPRRGAGAENQITFAEPLKPFLMLYEIMTPGSFPGVQTTTYSV